MNRPRWRAIALPLALCTTVPGVVAAQVVTLDEGSFTLIRGNERTGHENFSIRSTQSGPTATVIARATVLSGPRRVDPLLSADTTGFPLAYQSVVRVEGREVQRYAGLFERDRFSARAQFPDGESAREFRLAPGTVAVDDEIVHQLWFIARRGAGARVTVLVPNRNVIETVRVEAVGQERLTIETRELEVTRYRLTTAFTGVVREVWLDAAGRIIKAQIPALRLLAVRDER